MTLLPERIWTQEQWELIGRGYRARDMDEKWNVFVEGHVAFLHRSWTGYGMFEAAFSRVPHGWRISAAVTESAPKGARDARAQASQILLELVLCSVVLGEPATGLRAELVRLCSPPDRPAPPPGLVEHTLLGLRSDEDAT